MNLTALARPLLLLALLLGATSSAAQEFSLVVSPPRFEDRAKPGETYRNVFEMTNTSPRAAKFSVYTADWAMDAQHSPVFSQALAPGSCRPWVGIEARELSIAGNGRRRFRFEVAVPADAPRGECRFAIMIEGEPQPARGDVPLPVSGRIGVIVYLAIGDARSQLAIAETVGADVQGERLPVLRVRNDGDGHGRLDGFLAGVDAKGQRFVLVPDNSPILPGVTRDIPLRPQPLADGSALPAIVYPLRIRGRLDAERQRLDVDATVPR